MATKEPKYSLWTAPANPSNFPLGNIGRKELEKIVASIDWEKIAKEEREDCEHKRVWNSTIITTRGIYDIRTSYFCMDCGLKSKTPIGIYKTQETNELDEILSQQSD